MSAQQANSRQISFKKGTIPGQWIGVRAAWPLLSQNPWEHLISISPKEMTTHALLIGATGCGKTNLLHHLIAQDLERGHSICLLDMRGDLVSAVLEMCAGLVDPEKVKVLDLREKVRPFGFNPLHGSGEPYFRALNVLDVISNEADSWGVQLAETLRNALMLLSEAHEHLTDLESLFYNAEFRYACLKEATSEPVRAFWQRFDLLSPERQAGFAMPVLNKVSLLLATPTLRRILGNRNPIDLGQHLNTPGSITLVSLAVDELHASGRMMGSLVLSAVCREIFARVNVAEKDRNPVRLYVDEFEHFGMKDFEAILAEGRRFALSLVLAHQTLAQLSPRMRSMILNNVGVKFAFRCGREDSATLSRDIFGSTREYDLVDLPRGYAVLWRRDTGCDEVEINEPFLKHIGTLSAKAEAFVSEVYGQSESTTDPIYLEQYEPVTLEPVEQRPANFKTLPASLEDWLCG